VERPSGSGAVPAEHPDLVLQLTPDRLDEVAVLAHELGVLFGLHLDGKRLDAVFPAQGKDRLVVFLFFGRDPLFGLLVQDLVEARLAFLLGLGYRVFILLFVVFVLCVGQKFLFVFHLGLTCGPFPPSRTAGLYAREGPEDTRA
jgi:hypothetical protein